MGPLTPGLRLRPDTVRSDDHVREMQSEMLRLLLGWTVAGYIIWHIAVGPLVDSSRYMVSFVTTGPVLALVVAGSYLIRRRRPRLAAWGFVFGILLAITWSIYALNAPEIATFYVIGALLAALLIHPLTGLLAAVASEGLLWLASQARPGLVDSWEFWRLAILSALGVATVWALTRQLLLVLDWYVHSYGEARAKRREANEHRAELVKARRQLEDANYRLHRANSALEVALQAADEAERSKMEFATNVSHELRTPLNLIVGYSEMMMSSPASYGGAVLPAAYRGDLNAIYRSAEHLRALADDVLDLATMEVGRLSLACEPLDLRLVARDAAALMGDYVEAKKLSLELDLPEELPLILADRLRVRQVVLNLLANAVRFTEHGAIVIRVRAEESRLVMSVSDSGAGISPDELARLFQRFVTSEGDKGTWHAGSGLGLSISKRMVEMHGGEMGAESEKGVGTTFWFTLPKMPSGVVDQLTGGRGTVLGTHAHQPAVVLALPDRALAGLLQRHLNGFAVEMADGLSQAQARAADLGAVAVIADPEYCDDVGEGTVPVVYCPLPHAQGLARKLGVAASLVKPVSHQALRDTLKAIDCRPKRILVVDDNPRFARLLSRMLSSDYPDCTISLAYNGIDALERIASEAPDLVLLDLIMPAMSGLDVLDRLAADTQGRSPTIVTVSANQIADRAAPVGSDLRIVKPEGFQLAELMDVLAAALGKINPARDLLIRKEQASPEAPPESPASAGKQPRQATPQLEARKELSRR